jgi:sarcosine oxidase subunit beta
VKASVLIVGGGVMGTSIALSTARHFDPLRQPVVLLERHSMASGSTAASGAILRQHYASRTIASMARDSLRAYSSFESRTGRALGYRRTGVLTLAGPGRPGSIERLRENVAQHHELGIATEVLDAAGIRRLVPRIEVHDEAIAAWEPQGGYVDAHETVQQFAALARTYGAVTRMGVEILSIELRDGRVVGAETSEGHYECSQLVIVAGAHSRELLRKLGVDLPIHVARVEQHFFRLPTAEGAAAAPQEKAGGTADVDLDDPLESERDRTGSADANVEGLPHPVVLDLELGFYTRCEPAQGRTRVCPIHYEESQIFPEPTGDESNSPERAEWARRVLSERFPLYRDEPEVAQRVSWFPLTPDGRALIGPVPGAAGVYVVAGFADHGFKLAPSVGEGMAQLLSGQPLAAFEAEYFDPARFQGVTVTPDWSGQQYL